MINNFCNSFTTEIRQTIMNDRMKATCTKEKFIEIITHHDMKIFKKEKLKTTNEIFRIIIRNMLMQTKKKSDNLVIVLFWSKADSSILNISQHHKAMLIKINKRTKIIKKNVNKKIENFLLKINHEINCIYFLIWVESLI